ncbi:MAG TPA: pyridoxamine 5-phosphate oxidase [Maritimibacter sp.]|nr:pyridoxamine 5-phosphate oxidase [Maritimibacter sp.]
MTTTDPIRPTDDDARALARQLMSEATFAALSYLAPEGTPSVARVAVSLDENGAPILLVSDLSAHTQALASNPACALLLGEPGNKGDPLTHPRLTLEGIAEPVEKTAAMRDRWLASHPKSKLYIDFADFRFLRVTPRRGFLNGGFGKAFRLTPGDLGL